jgi:hypothetical protein
MQLSLEDLRVQRILAAAVVVAEKLAKTLGEASVVVVVQVPSLCVM